MKCTKCGFVSFDYLSECKKCGTPLTGIREALGLASTKPAVPFFLGSLLKDPEKHPAPGRPDAAEHPFASFDFGEEDSQKFLDEHPAAAAAIPESGGGSHDSDDFNLLDISDEELDLLIEEGESQKPAGQGRPGETGKTAGPAAGATGEPERIAGKDAGGLVLESDASAMPGLSRPGEPPKQSGPAPVLSLDVSEDDEDLEIELSEKDLEALLSELEQSAPAKKKQPPDPKSGSGSEEKQ